MTLDWGEGDYEPTAAVLAPAAEAVLDAIGLCAGERLIDVGCGTGNALIAAALRGAEVAGFDPSPGLAARASERLAERGLQGDVRVGTAEAPPPGLAPADAVVSLFAVIFAADPPSAAAGLVSLCKPGGRIALTAWLPSGAIAAAGQALRSAIPGPPPADPPRWHEQAWVAALLEAGGARDVTVSAHDLVFRHESPEAWFAEQEALHPAWLAARAGLGEDVWPTVRARSLDALREQNEDPAAFAATSGYVVVRAAR